MIKSFQGARAAQTKVIPTMLKVSDVMSKKPYTFSPQQSIFEVMDIIVKKKISGAPVINGQNELCGIISEGDCLKILTKGKYENTPQTFGTVEDYMNKKVVTIEHDVDILEAAKKFLTMRIRRFPVIKEGKVIGLISQKDLLKAVMGLA